MNTKKYLESKDGHNIYYECHGAKNNTPVIFLHGGPGSGCSPSSKTFFDKKKWFAVFFDQRGCGLSKPSGEVKNNTVQTLVQDIEMLRNHLGIKRWVVFGGSWGSTLALKYAYENPETVSALVLRGVFLASDKEIDWFLLGLRRFIPKEWDNFVENINSKDCDSFSIINYYHEALFSADKEKALSAAQSWRNWEEAAMRLTYEQEYTEEKKECSTSNRQEEEKILSSMKVHLHYLKNKCFLNNEELINNVSSLKKIPTFIIQGQLDTICPPETAEILQKKMPWAVLNVIKGAGHGAYEKPIRLGLLKALEQLWEKLKNES